MKEDLLRERLEQGYVVARKHPTLPLTIYNYGAGAQFDNVWDEATEQCRGLIVDGGGYIVSRPFRKFFNLNTSWRPETHEANLPSEQPEVYDKLDGSLGIVWAYDGQVGVATRGSFDSEQARWATAWLHKTYPEWVQMLISHPEVPKEFSYLFEIVYRENRIVVDYDFEGLVLLAVIYPQDGNELSWDGLRSCSWPGRRVERFNKSLRECVSQEDKVNEGYVLFYRDARLRVKIKFAEYMRLHRLLTGISPKAVWEMLRDNADFTPLETDVPESFSKWLSRWKRKMLWDYRNIYDEAYKLYDTIPAESRKHQAEFILRRSKELQAEWQLNFAPLLFNMLDNDGHFNERGIAKLWMEVKPRVSDGDVFRKDTES
jgi:RNA ligase